MAGVLKGERRFRLTSAMMVASAGRVQRPRWMYLLEQKVSASFSAEGEAAD